MDGKLDLAMQWAFEQEEAGGEVNFKEGLAFYSSIGILQVDCVKVWLHVDRSNKPAEPSAASTFFLKKRS